MSQEEKLNNNDDVPKADINKESIKEHLSEEKKVLANENYLEILRTRIDILEIKTAEKSEAWYKTFGGITGLIAIFMSLFSIGYSMFKDKSGDTEARKKEIRENVNNMLELSAVVKKEAGLQGVTPDYYVANHDEIGRQFEIYLNNIDVVHKLIPGKLSSEAYNYIGYCYFHFSYQTIKAFEYYNYALEAAGDAFDSSNVYLYLSNNYYSKGLYFDTVKARQYLQKDIQILRNAPDDRGYYFLIRDFATAASDFESSINLHVAADYIDSAKYYLKSFKVNRYMYEDLRLFINQKTAYINLNYKMQIDSLARKN